MTSKKHFERAAALVKELRRVGEIKAAQITADEFIHWFGGDNPRFDRGRFLKACGL